MDSTSENTVVVRHVANSDKFEILFPFNEVLRRPIHDDGTTRDDPWLTQNLNRCSSCSVKQIQFIEFNLPSDNMWLNMIVQKMPEICADVMIERSKRGDAAFVEKISLAYAPGMLKALTWIESAFESVPDVQGVALGVLSRHKAGLEGFEFGRLNEQLLVAISQLEALQTIRIHDGSVDNVAVYQALENMTTLKEFELDAPKDAAFDSYGPRVIALGGFLSKLKGLQSLKISGHFPVHYNAILFSGFCDRLIALPIRNLDMSFNKIGKAASEICRVIKASQTIRELSLIGVDFNFDDQQELFYAFGQNISLRNVRWGCRNVKLEARCMLVNPNLEFPNHCKLADIKLALKIRKLPCVQVIVVILHAMAAPKPGYKSKINLFRFLSLDLVRYLYSFYEQVIDAKEKFKNQEESDDDGIDEDEELNEIDDDDFDDDEEGKFEYDDEEEYDELNDDGDVEFDVDKGED